MINIIYLIIYIDIYSYNTINIIISI